MDRHRFRPAAPSSGRARHPKYRWRHLAVGRDTDYRWRPFKIKEKIGKMLKKNSKNSKKKKKKKKVCKK